MKIEFENGYGVSVIETHWGLKDVRVMHDGKLCYDTPITSDAMGHLTDTEVMEIIEQVKQLPKKA